MVMEETTLPLVAMEFEGSPVNPLDGYVEEMHIPSMRDTNTPVPERRKLPFSIEACGNEIRSVEYEVRDLSGENLIESRSCDSLSTEGDITR